MAGGARENSTLVLVLGCVPNLPGTSSRGAGMGRLDGRVAIVTGAGGGIGREHALLLAREGAAVVVDDIGTRTGADAEAVVQAIRDQGGAAVATRASATGAAWGSRA